MIAAPLSDYGPQVYHAACAILAFALVISVYTDLRWRLILNWVTYPALALELLLVGLGAGWYGLELSGMGLLICAGPLILGNQIPLYKLLRGKRAPPAAVPGTGDEEDDTPQNYAMGDIKLMALCGVVAGAAGNWPFAIKLLLYVSIAGGLTGLGNGIYRAAQPASGAEEAGTPHYVPYGVAIALGTAAAFWLPGFGPLG